MSLARVGGHGLEALSGGLLGLIAVFFWSTNALAAKYALLELSVAQVVFLQFASAAAVISLSALLPQQPPPAAQVQPAAGRAGAAPGALAAWRWLLAPGLAVVGIVGTIAFQYLAFAHAPIAQANLIAYAWPLLTAVWLAVVLRPAGSAKLVALAMLGFLGVALLIGGPRLLAFQLGAAPGYLFAVLSAICMATYTLGVARLREWRVTAILPALLLGAIAMGAISLLRAEAVPAFWAIALGIYIGVGPMALGYAFWSLAVRRDGSGRVAVLAYLTPVVSTVWLVASGERLSAVGWLGALLVLLAITLLGRSGRPGEAKSSEGDL
jgi:drug/metabolite transporter (DMT)-like permease